MENSGRTASPAEPNRTRNGAGAVTMAGGRETERNRATERESACKSNESTQRVTERERGRGRVCGVRERGTVAVSGWFASVTFSYLAAYAHATHCASLLSLLRSGSVWKTALRSDASIESVLWRKGYAHASRTCAICVGISHNWGLERKHFWYGQETLVMLKDVVNNIFFIY